MKKATVYFTEKQRGFADAKRRSMTIEVPDEMFASWDWDGIERIFRAKAAPYTFRDSTIRVNRIKLGRATLKG